MTMKDRRNIALDGIYGMCVAIIMFLRWDDVHPNSMPHVANVMYQEYMSYFARYRADLKYLEFLISDAEATLRTLLGDRVVDRELRAKK